MSDNLEKFTIDASQVKKILSKKKKISYQIE